MAATSAPDSAGRLSPAGLRDLLAVVNSSRGLDEILRYLVVQAKAALGTDGAALYLRDEDNPSLLRVKAAHGVPPEMTNETVWVGYPVTGLAVARRRTVVACDIPGIVSRPFADRVDDQVEEHGTYLEVVRPGPASALDRPLQQHNQQLAEAYRTIAAHPLVAHDQTYGALVLYYRAQQAFSAEQLDLSLTFAQQAALAIENSRLRAQAEQRLGEILRRQRVAEALRDLLAVVNSNQDLDETLAEVLAQSSRLLGNAAGAVYLRETDSDEILRVRAALGIDTEHLALEVRVGSPTTGLAVQQGRTLVCNDLAAVLDDDLRASDTQLEDLGAYARIVRMGAYTDPDLETRPQPRVRGLVQDFRAVVATPLISRGRAFGAITLFYAEPRAFTAEEVDLAAAFGQQATLAIENARLHREAEQRLREIERRRRVAEGISDLLQVVNSTRSLDEILDRVLAQASDLLGNDAGSVLLLDESQADGPLLRVRASRSVIADLIPMRLPVGGAVTGVAVERRRSVAVSDLLETVPAPDERQPLIEDGPGFLKLRRIGDFGPRGPGAFGIPRVRDVARHYRALLAVPLAVRGRTQGAITLYYREPREFTPEEVGLAEAFADQTALAMENARLHAQTVRRSRDLEALYRADEVLYRSLRLDQVLQGLVDVATDVLQSDATSVLVWDERRERLVPGATRGFRPENVARMSHPIGGEGITIRVATSGVPIAVEDAVNDPRVAHRITDNEGIRSLLHVPIKVNGQVFGVFGVNYRQPRTLAGDEERVLLALAHRAAVAIENAQLYAESEQRRQELDSLYRADEALHRSLRLDDVLRALADVATDVLQADKTAVHVWVPDRRRLVAAAAHGYSDESLVQELTPGEDIRSPEALGNDLLVVDEALRDERLSPRLMSIMRRENIHSAIAAPITLSGQFFGLFSVAFCQRHNPTQEQQRLVQALAQRAGLAIQNARLFEQAQQVATAEERQRLARELHDAVTQTLFSASLIAEVVPRLWERNQDDGRKRLEELRRLTRGALAEMRTLLLELRPAALIETPFVQLVNQLGEAAASRSNLEVSVRSEGEPCPVPPEVQIALYRIAQEALNNTGKHAAATHAELHLRWRPDGINVRITDNGRGFDPRATPPGHLGMGIMQERARAIGARLRVESRPGNGTRISVQWRGA